MIGSDDDWRGMQVDPVHVPPSLTHSSQQVQEDPSQTQYGPTFGHQTSPGSVGVLPVGPSTPGQTQSLPSQAQPGPALGHQSCGDPSMPGQLHCAPSQVHPGMSLL